MHESKWSRAFGSEPSKLPELCLAHDLARIGQELEVHGVFDLGVTEPVETEALEFGHPAGRHIHALELALLVLAALTGAPFPDAATTRVPRRIHVQRDAVDMVGGL